MAGLEPPGAPPGTDDARAGIATAVGVDTGLAAVAESVREQLAGSHLRLAKLLLATDPESALGRARKAYELRPDSAAVQAVLGRIEKRVGMALRSSDPEAALAHLREAHRLDPEDDRVTRRLGRLELRVGKSLVESDPATAAVHLRDALRLAPGDEHVVRVLARALRATDQHDEANELEGRLAAAEGSS